MDELIDFAAISTQVDAPCPRPDRSKCGRPPPEVMVRLVFIQSLYSLSDEDCEHQVMAVGDRPIMANGSEIATEAIGRATEHVH